MRPGPVALAFAYRIIWPYLRFFTPLGSYTPVEITMIGNVLSRCTVLEELGESGSGVVFKTEELKLKLLTITGV